MVNALSISTGVPKPDRRRDLTELTGSVHNTCDHNKEKHIRQVERNAQASFQRCRHFGVSADYSQVSNTFLIFETVSLGGGVLRTLFADEDASDFVAVPVMLTVFPLN
jgi:hypothetical protein